MMLPERRGLIQDCYVVGREWMAQGHGGEETHVAEVLHVAHKVALCVKDLVQALLTLLFRVGGRVGNVLRD